MTATPIRVHRTIDDRLDRLRAERGPEAARDTAWSWLCELSVRARQDREGALADLDELFREGRPSDIDGQTDGMLVTFAVTPLLDRAVAGITAAWMPWAGKRFDTGAAEGANTLAGSARLPARLLWPLYRLRPHDDGRVTAFDFTTRVEPGALGPGTDVLVIDYAPVSSNPRLLIRSIRDELVEIVPGAHLGKMLWRHGDGHHSLAAYFALRSDPRA